MKINIVILIAFVLIISALSSVAMASNPLVKEKHFLMSDPDGDTVLNWEEFQVGTDPFNPDSDNDGLPDWWELEHSSWRNKKTKNAIMDPTDSSDAHLDFDYEPIHDAQGYEIGERDSEFRAIKHFVDGTPMVWPSNKDQTYTAIVFDEESMHYDNYEEYYRPVYDKDKKSITGYIHTNPLYPDSDGDKILDPDDYAPLNINDSISQNYKGTQNQINNLKNKIDMDSFNHVNNYIEPIIPTIYDSNKIQSTSGTKHN